MNWMSDQNMHGGGVVVIAALLAATLATAQAQVVNPPQGASPAPATVNPPADTMAVPGFWDPRRRPERPDLSRISIIRFLTETDYPPFNYAGPDGAPIGFNVELARLICEEIKVACTVQMRRFDAWISAIRTTVRRRDSWRAATARSKTCVRKRSREKKLQ
jgi:polar amino acid transport system substrate-binding protein